MAALVIGLQIRARVQRAFSEAGRFSKGAPTAFVAAVAAFVLIAILYTIAAREPSETRAFAEFTLSRQGCAIEARTERHASRCERVSRGVYRVTFTQSIAASTVLASRGSCCPGPIGASLDSPASVLVVVPGPLRAPIRASVFVP
jgi:hypothetical protein